MMAGSLADWRRREYSDLRAQVQAQILEIRREFGAPGDYGYNTDAGRILFRSLTALHTLDAILFERIDRPAPDGVA